MDDLVSGRYRLDARIGSGGMAEVWRATDVRTGGLVALKRLHPQLADDERARARFAREVEAARAVHHPAAVRLLDAAADEPVPWLAMEYVEGGSLATRLAGGPVPEAEAAAIGADVADALAALHAAGLVHRDVTPSNILLPDGGGGRLADFGIARGAPADELPEVTATGDLVGTLRFMAPEVLAGSRAAPTSDVWGLGAVLYEAVSGIAPFDASSPAALLESQRTPAAPIGTVDAAFGALIARMLSVEPAARPAAAEAARQLRSMAPVDAATERTVEMPSPGSLAFAGAVAGGDSHPQPVRSHVSTTARGRRTAALLATAAIAALVLVGVAATAGAAPGEGQRADATATQPAAAESTPDARPTPHATARPAPATAAPAAAGGKPPKDDAKGKGNGSGKDDGKGNGKGKDGG